MLNLKDLHIRREPYGPDKGNYVGEIIFDATDQRGIMGPTEVKIVLTAEHCAQLFAVVADAVLATAKDAATHLVIEAEAQRAKLVTACAIGSA